MEYIDYKDFLKKTFDLGDYKGENLDFVRTKDPYFIIRNKKILLSLLKCDWSKEDLDDLKDYIEDLVEEAYNEYILKLKQLNNNYSERNILFYI